MNELNPSEMDIELLTQAPTFFYKQLLYIPFKKKSNVFLNRENEQLMISAKNKNESESGTQNSTQK